MRKDANDAKAELEKIKFLSDCCKDHKLYNNMVFYSLTYDEQNIPKLEEVVGTGLVVDGGLYSFVGDDQETIVEAFYHKEADVAYNGLVFCVWLSHPNKIMALHLFAKAAETNFDHVLKESNKMARRYKEIINMLQESMKKEEE